MSINFTGIELEVTSLIMEHGKNNPGLEEDLAQLLKVIQKEREKYDGLKRNAFALANEF